MPAARRFAGLAHGLLRRWLQRQRGFAFGFRAGRPASSASRLFDGVGDLALGGARSPALCGCAALGSSSRHLARAAVPSALDLSPATTACSPCRRRPGCAPVLSLQQAPHHAARCAPAPRRSWSAAARPAVVRPCRSDWIDVTAYQTLTPATQGQRLPPTAPDSAVRRCEIFMTTVPCEFLSASAADPALPVRQRRPPWGEAAARPLRGVTESL